jgi:hypothetical protein
MNKVSEKINRKSMGGLMKIRFLMVALIAMAVIVPNVAKAQSNGSLTFPSMVLTPKDPSTAFDMKAAILSGFGADATATGSKDKGNALSYSQCILQQRDDFDKATEMLSTALDGLDTILSHRYEYKLGMEGYKYQEQVNTNNMTLQALNITVGADVTKTIANDYYLYGGGMYGNSGSMMNVSPGVKAYSAEQYGNTMSNYFSGFGGN